RRTPADDGEAPCRQPLRPPHTRRRGEHRKTGDQRPRFRGPARGVVRPGSIRRRMTYRPRPRIVSPPLRPYTASPTSANGALRLRFLTSVERAEQPGAVELPPGGVVVQHLARTRFAEGHQFPGGMGTIEEALGGDD